MVKPKTRTILYCPASDAFVDIMLTFEVKISIEFPTSLDLNESDHIEMQESECAGCGEDIYVIKKNGLWQMADMEQNKHFSTYLQKSVKNKGWEIIKCIYQHPDDKGLI